MKKDKIESYMSIECSLKLVESQQIPN